MQDSDQGTPSVDTPSNAPSPAPFETRRLMRYFVTDHETPYLVDARSICFGIVYQPFVIADKRPMCFDPDSGGWGEPEPSRPH